MLDKIKDNIKRARYLQNPNPTSKGPYINKNGGWNDYILAEKFIFSHRINDYTPENFPEDLHAHDYYELTLTLSGSGMQYITDKHNISIRRATVILTKPMKIHMFRSITPTRYDRYVIYFRAAPDLFADKSILDFLQKGDQTCAVFEFSDDSILSYAQKAQTALMDTHSPYASARAFLYICNIFLALSDSQAVSTGDMESSAPNFINEIKQYVDEEFLGIRSVADITKKFFYSREYITRSFRRYYNTPLYEYVIKRKMLYCCTLLRQGESVDAAASRSGFGNMSSFIKLFRKFNGCTPSEYKAKVDK